MVDRRLPHPLTHGQIIIDIGSGARPYGNIQLDIYPEDSDTHHKGTSIHPTVFADADFYHIPFRAGIAYRVLLLHIIEHLKCPFCALEDVNRIMKKDASVRIELPNPRLWEHERDEHLYSWHPDTFKNIVKATGFTTKIYHQGGKNHSIEALK